MRITSNITSNNALYNIQKSRAQLDSLSEKLASQKNINRPSDDPVNARLLIGLGDKITASNQYNNNITKAQIWVKTTSTALDGMYSYVNQAKSLVSSLVSGTTDSNIQQNAISQLQAIKQQIVDMGNTQLDGVYIFGGGVTSTSPFASTSPYYHGDETALSVDIGQGMSETMNLIGSQVLQPSEGTSTPYGSTDILTTIDSLISTITSDPTNTTVLQAGAQALYKGGLQLESAISAVATKATRLDNASTMNTSTKNTLLTIFDNVQTADYAELGVKLTQQQTAFNATLSATAKITQMSLLDFL